MGQHRILLILLLSCLTSCAGNRTKTYPPVKIKGVWHTAQARETLPQLAHRYGVPLEDIEEINGIDRADPLVSGRQIFLPGTRHPAPRRPIEVQPAPAVKRGGRDFLWPIKRGGKLSSPFGLRGKRPHEGIDIAAPAGTPILAAADGTVIYSGSGVRGYGNLILIQHKGGMVTVYAHNRRNLAQEGQKVRQGQNIAEVGRTGRTSGDHLHFEIRHGETPLNPLEYTNP